MTHLLCFRYPYQHLHNLELKLCLGHEESLVLREHTFPDPRILQAEQCTDHLHAVGWEHQL